MQFRVDLRDYQPRPGDRRVQMLDAEPGIVPPGFVRAADLQQHDGPNLAAPALNNTSVRAGS
jgi:hypothetical protein